MKLSDLIIQTIIILHLSFVGLFRPKVAERAKRMLFLTSLATELAKQGIIKINVLDTINSNLKLADNDNSLAIAKELSSSIWRHTDFKDKFDLVPEGYLNINEIRKISNDVVQGTPKFMRYNLEKMKSDVTDFFIFNPIKGHENTINC